MTRRYIDMNEDAKDNKYKYTAEFKQMKEYYEGEFELINRKNVIVMLVSAILTAFFLLYIFLCEWMYAKGNLSVGVLNSVRILVVISMIETFLFYLRNIIKALFHVGYMYDAEQFFNFNCLVDNTIKNIYVINSKDKIVLYIMRGIRYARLNEYTVKGGKGRVRVVDMNKKIIEV